MSQQTQSLAMIGDLAAARRALDDAATLPDVADLIDRAAIVQIMARQAKLSLDAQNDWAEYKLDAERRAGAMLAEMDIRAGRPQEKWFRDGIIPSRNHFRLDDLGIEKKQSFAWQRLAAIPVEPYEQYKADMRAQAKEITQTGALRLAKEHQRETKRDANRLLVIEAAPVAHHLAGATYQTLVLDPPWDWGDEGDVDQFGRARPTYATMPIAEIAALPIPALAAANAHIYLWITNRSLPKGFVLLESWGFRYVTLLTWTKPSIGMGNYFRGSTEHVLFGVRGSLPLLRRDVGTWFSAVRPNLHSGKPEAFYALIETCSPGPWLELFARRARPGWVTWGAEV